jgi:hypothetical protein
VFLSDGKRDFIWESSPQKINKSEIIVNQPQGRADPIRIEIPKGSDIPSPGDSGTPPSGGRTCAAVAAYDGGRGH